MYDSSSATRSTEGLDPAARLKALLDVAKALTSQRDLDKLLQIILVEATRVADADRGSLFLVDPDTGDLWSKIAHGLNAGSEIRIPAGVGIAGAVAASGQTVNLPDAYADARFNPLVDRETGYRTHSLLCVPLKNMRGEVVGVLQLLNKSGGVFTSDDEDLLMAFGGQAAAAIENVLLQAEITRLFEGFVQASVVAIESRDPTTGGHSERVARLTLGLADAVEVAGQGRWRGTSFTAEQRMQLRYASLLHDFGKVGVREDVLVKAHKLFPHQLELIRQRFEYAKKSMEADSLRRRLDLLVNGSGPDVLVAEEHDLAVRMARLDDYLDLVLASNRPTVLAGGSFEALNELQSVLFSGPDGQARPLLTPGEVATLSIPKGSLTAEERREIESHVTHTFRFLSQIPWTRSLRRVPMIAHGHHEKLDGTGYPVGLPAEEICVESRMMAIADIYDALTASDRPYKKAVPHDIALRILDDEVARGQIDGDLVEVFRAERVPLKVLGQVSEPRHISGLF